MTAELTRRTVLGVTGASIESGPITGFPTIQAKKIKNITLRQFGTSVSNLNAIAEKVKSDLGFTISMTALYSATLAQDKHAVMVLDGAGWHTSHDLAIPPNLSLLRLPPYAPELNPVERIWLYLRERHLSHRVHDGYRAILDAVCEAWCQLTPERFRSLCNYPWIRQVNR